MKLLKWFNGWKVMAIAAAAGYLAFSIYSLMELGRLYSNCLRWRDGAFMSDGADGVLTVLLLACALLVMVGLIWGLVSLFVRIEQRRAS